MTSKSLWYTILAGVAAAVTLTMHGALWLNYKTTGVLQERARRGAKQAFCAVIVITVLLTGASFAQQPQIAANFASFPWGCVFPALALAGLVTVLRFLTRDGALKAFPGSCMYIAGMLTRAAFGVFPMVLPSEHQCGSEPDHLQYCRG